MSDNSNNLGSDRTVPPLQKGAAGSGLLGLGAILVLGTAGIVWALTSGKKDKVTEVKTEEYREVQSNDFELPQIAERPTPRAEPIVVPEPKVSVAARPDPRNLERQVLNNRDADRAEEERLRRLEREKAERLQRRSASLVIYDKSDSFDEPVESVMTAQEIENARVLSGLSSRLDDREARDRSNDEVRDELAQQEIDKGSELFQSENSRFLRDAGNSQVKMAKAVKLPDQDFLITQGTMIPGVLETAIHSDLSGMIRAQTIRPVYSHTGSTVLIPRGSTLIGRYQNGLKNGQSRVFVVWTRVERADGIVIDIASPGTDSLGRTGMTGDVDSHFWERFGTSFMFSIIGAGVIVAGDSNNNSSVQREVIRDTGNSFSRSAEIALENSINIPPTIHVDQGERLNVFVAKDLNFKVAIRGY